MHNFEDENCQRKSLEDERSFFSGHAGLKVLRTRSARSGTISLIDAGNLTTVNELHDSG